MEHMDRRAANTSRRIGPILIIAAALMLVRCGGETGSNGSTAPGTGDETLGLKADDRSRARSVRRFGAEVPVAYYDLSFRLSKRTGGITPPVQARIFAYMGLALYESLIGGMRHHQSIASHLNGIGQLPQAHGNYHWPLVASAAMAEVMRGLWGDATNVAAQNIADIDTLEAQFAAAATDVHGLSARSSIDFGHAVGAAIFETSKDDGEHRSYRPTSRRATCPRSVWGSGCLFRARRRSSPSGEIRMTPFVSAGAACDPGPPPAYSETPGSTFYDEAFEVYDAPRI